MSAVDLRVPLFIANNSEDPKLVACLVDMHPGLVEFATPKVALPAAWVLAQQRGKVELACFAVRNCTDPETLQAIAAKAKRESVKAALSSNKAFIGSPATAPTIRPTPRQQLLSRFDLESGQLLSFAADASGRRRMARTPSFPDLLDALREQGISDEEQITLLDLFFTAGLHKDLAEVLSYEIGAHPGPRAHALARLVSLFTDPSSPRPSPALNPSFLLALGLSDEQFAALLPIYQLNELGTRNRYSKIDRSLTFARTRAQLVTALSSETRSNYYTSLPDSIFGDDMLTGYDDPLLAELLPLISPFTVSELILGKFTRDGRPCLPDLDELQLMLRSHDQGPELPNPVVTHLEKRVASAHAPLSYKLMLLEQIPGTLPAAMTDETLGSVIYQRLVTCCPDAELLIDQLTHCLDRSLLEIERVLGALYRAGSAYAQS